MADKRKLQGTASLTRCLCGHMLTVLRTPPWMPAALAGANCLSPPRPGEIDRCLKKVSEGVEQFEDIWQKV